MMISLVALIVVGAIILGGLALIVSLLNSKRGGSAVALLLGGGGLCLLLMFAFLFVATPTRSYSPPVTEVAFVQNSRDQLRPLRNRRVVINGQQVDGVSENGHIININTSHSGSIAEAPLEPAPPAPSVAEVAASMPEFYYSASELDQGLRTPAQSFSKGFNQGVSITWGPMVAIGAVLLLAIVAALIFKSKAGVGIVVALLFLMVFGSFFYARQSAVPTPGAVSQIATSAFDPQRAPVFATATGRSQIQSRLDVVSQTANIWTQATNDTFVSKTYGSLDQLGRGVGTRVIGFLSERGIEPKSINVTVDNPFPEKVLPFDAVKGCADRLREAIPDADVKANLTNATAAVSDGPRVNVDFRIQQVTKRMAPWDASQYQNDHKISATVTCNGDQDLWQLEYLEKPWLDDLAKHLARYPNHALFRARSSSLEQSETEARRNAFANAANQIAPELDSYIAHRYPDLSGISDKKRKQYLFDAIANKNLFVIDQFPQSFEKPGMGDVWRDAVLVNVSDRSLQRVANNMRSNHQVQQTRQMSKAGGLIGLMLLIIATTIGLNATTKGYYKHPIFGIGAGVVVVLMLLFIS